MPTNKQRQDAARRHLERQLQRRAEKDTARRRNTLIASVVGTLIVVAIVVVFIVSVTNDDKKGSAAGTVPCTFTQSGSAAKKVELPKASVPGTGTVGVSVNTTQGNLTVSLNRASAPCTVASFVSLVQQHYYDRTPCHRLVTSSIYVLQCGDPTGSGSGGPGYTVPDEATGNETYPAGTVAMARSQAPNSGGSQFFIVYKDSPNLAQNLGAQQYTVFGKVSSGLDTITKIAAGGAASGTDGAPKLATEITSMTLTK
jgi:peptidyl-prolyl cis-trans isomerase B (cyclophilin B)